VEGKWRPQCSSIADAPPLGVGARPQREATLLFTTASTTCQSNSHTAHTERKHMRQLAAHVPIPDSVQVP